MPILGIDEVGRGPWAGPLVIGAVILPERFDRDGELVASQSWQDDLADSKKISESKRKRLSEKIYENAVTAGLGWVSAEEIDEIGLMPALELATRRAINNVLESTTHRAKFTTHPINNVLEQKTHQTMPLSQTDTLDDLPKKLPFDEIIIDGTINFLKNTPLENLVTTLIKADDRIKEVSAASIIAKVARDAYMKELSGKYPGYSFEKNVGYGTAAHREVLEKLGPCPEHRYFIKPLAKQYSRESTAKNAKNTKNTAPKKCLKTSTTKNLASAKPSKKLNTTNIGSRAETVVANYLKENGHKILARNYKTKYYEIDIISATKDHIYFTEVKYRKTNSYGDPLEFIDHKKQKQITFAAQAFMNFLSKKLDRDLDNLPSPILAAAAVEGPDFTIKEWIELET